MWFWMVLGVDGTGPPRGLLCFFRGPYKHIKPPLGDCAIYFELLYPKNPGPNQLGRVWFGSGPLRCGGEGPTLAMEGP